MTANSDSQNSDQSAFIDQNSSKQAIDVLQRDRFELLSAYLDGEVSADERRQVEDWLAHDPTVQRLHSRLLKLRQAFQTMSVPTSDPQSVQHTVDAVLARVDRRSHLTKIWGGIAIAAVAVGAMTTTLIMGSPFEQRTARQVPVAPASPIAREEPLLVALDKPLVSIPPTETPAPKSTSPLTNPNSTVR